MDNLENIYNQAVAMLKAGHSQEEVLLKFAEHRNELAPLLALSADLFAMPKNIVPTPLMKRRYEFVPAKNFWLTWLHVSKFAGTSVSLALLLSVFVVTGYQASKSSPGQSLFAVKKSAEQFQVMLASNQNKASLQIEIAQKRLTEAQQIFKDPNSGVEEKKAALNELADQTSSAIDEVKTVAKNNPVSDKNSPLLNSLDNITHEQENLLAEIKPDNQITTVASNALHTLNENTAKISEIKQSVAVAEKEQALAKLNADPDSVTVLGEIEKISKDQITVDKTTFVINSTTTIKDADGKILSLKDLNEKIKVNIIGQKNQTTVVAQQIVIITPGGQDPQVKEANTGVTTGQAGTSTQAAMSIKKPAEQNSSSTAPSAETPDPSTASGLFILENPEPQFIK